MPTTALRVGWGLGPWGCDQRLSDLRHAPHGVAHGRSLVSRMAMRTRAIRSVRSGSGRRCGQVAGTTAAPQLNSPETMLKSMIMLMGLIVRALATRLSTDHG